MKIMVDSIEYKTKPDCNNVCSAIKRDRRAKVSDLTIEEIITAVQSGKAVVPAVLSGSAADDFIEQQLILIDIDNDANEHLAKKTRRHISQLTENECTPILSVENALKISMNNGLPPCFYYKTFSHSDRKPKFRLAYILDKPVTDKIKRDVILKTIIGLFDQADKGAGNADRIFMGTDKQAVIVDYNAKINIENIYKLYRPAIRKVKNADSELEKLKRDFDLFGLMCEHNGDYKNIGGGYMFNDCNICGHRLDLVYYEDSNTWYCFSCGKGGTALDYIMMSENIDIKSAIKRLYELSGKEIPVRNNSIINMVSCSDDLLETLKKIQPDKNYNMDDLSYGRLFANVFKDVARYNTTVKSWNIYNGKVWVEDVESMAAHGYAKSLCDALLVYAVQMDDGSAKKDFIAWVSKYTILARRETMIRDARSENYFSKDDLDQNIYLFNCQNGTLDLKTFEFRAHSPNDLLSKISNVYYDPNVKSERWEQFINEVLQGDIEKTKYFQKLLGYCLTGLTEIEQFYILYGSTTRNGKSTAVETYGYMLGNSDGYALTISPETLSIKINKDSRSHSTDVARLKGARFVNAAEPPQRMLLDNALVKNWTGGDTISAREIFERQTEFKPMFKLFMNTNHLPIISDKTLFTSKRINIIEFNRHFEDYEQDTTLKVTLRKPENISGIFNWALEGLKLYYAQGLTPPQSVIDANKEYQDNSDKIQQFIDDCLIQTHGKHERAGIVYENYVNWCQGNGMMSLSKSNFFDELKIKGLFADIGTIGGQTVKRVVLNHQISETDDNTTVF